MTTPRRLTALLAFLTFPALLAGNAPAAPAQTTYVLSAVTNGGYDAWGASINSTGKIAYNQDEAFDHAFVRKKDGSGYELPRDPFAQNEDALTVNDLGQTLVQYGFP